MHFLDVDLISSWHAHVYFDAARRDAAWALKDAIESALGSRVVLGRFHETPVGPHPMWSYQLAFAAADLAAVVSWLALNHAGLDVLLHPNTNDELRDHRDAALWLGHSHQLDLAGLGP